jgi:hypothetical protein
MTSYAPCEPHVLQILGICQSLDGQEGGRL